MSSDNRNCSQLAATDVPTTSEYLTTLDAEDIVIISLSALFTLLINLIYVEELLFFARKMGYWKPKDKAVKLLSLYPVITNASFIAILVPRSSTLNDIIVSMYLAMCVYIFVVMLMGHFGGLHKMAARLQGYTVSAAAPPMCCCCKCLPDFQVDTLKLQLMELSVFQWVLIRPVLAYVAAVVWTNRNYEETLDPAASGTWLSLINVISTLIALYGFTLVYRLSRNTLSKMTIKPKFLVIQMVVTLTTFQPIILTSFAAGGLFPCDEPLSRTANANKWNHFLYTAEMVMLSVFARHFYRRHIGDAELQPEDKIASAHADVGTSMTLPRPQSSHDRPDSASPVASPYIHSGSVYRYGTLERPAQASLKVADYGIFNRLVRRERKKKAQKNTGGSLPSSPTGSSAPTQPSSVAATVEAVGPEQVVVDFSRNPTASDSYSRAQSLPAAFGSLSAATSVKFEPDSNQVMLNHSVEVPSSSSNQGNGRGDRSQLTKSDMYVGTNRSYMDNQRDKAVSPNTNVSGSFSPVSLTGSGMLYPGSSVPNPNVAAPVLSVTYTTPPGQSNSRPTSSDASTSMPANQALQSQPISPESRQAPAYGSLQARNAASTLPPISSANTAQNAPPVLGSPSNLPSGNLMMSGDYVPVPNVGSSPQQVNWAGPASNHSSLPIGEGVTSRPSGDHLWAVQ